MKNVTNLWVVLGGIITALVGFGIVLFSQTIVAAHWHTTVAALGSTLISTGTLAFIWELFSKRSFLAEIIQLTRVNERVRSAGINGMTLDFQYGISWTDHISKANDIDIMFSYGSTWRNACQSAFQKALTRRVHLRIALPDPDVADLTARLGSRFGKQPPEQLRRSIEEAVSYFQNLMQKAHPEAKLDIWYYNFDPLYTYYRFDNSAVMAIYKHRPGRGGVPTFEVADGELLGFLKDEFDTVTSDEKLSRKILSLPVPKPKPTGG